MKRDLGRLDIAPSPSENMSCMSLASFSLRVEQFLLSIIQESLWHLSSVCTMAKIISRT